VAEIVEQMLVETFVAQPAVDGVDGPHSSSAWRRVSPFIGPNRRFDYGGHNNWPGPGKALVPSPRH
jgi:hypothetical protein